MRIMNGKALILWDARFIGPIWLKQTFTSLLCQVLSSFSRPAGKKSAKKITDDLAADLEYNSN